MQCRSNLHIKTRTLFKQNSAICNLIINQHTTNLQATNLSHPGETIIISTKTTLTASELATKKTITSATKSSRSQAPTSTKSTKSEEMRGDSWKEWSAFSSHSTTGSRKSWKILWAREATSKYHRGPCHRPWKKSGNPNSPFLSMPWISASNPQQR